MKSINIKKESKSRNLKNIDEINELDYSKEIKLLNTLYLDISNNLYLENSFILRELTKKITSYKSQDEKKKIYNKDTLITINELLEKLVVSKLKCYYCNNIVKLIYKMVRTPNQWTLDRIDNSKNHSNENTIICCLECNLKRRNINSDKFNFTKKLILNKLN